MFYRGTTPTLPLKLETELSLESMSQIWVTIKSPLKERTYTKDEISVSDENKEIDVFLTQEDTLAFSEGTIEIQTRLLEADGVTAWATNVVKEQVGRILKDGVINGA